jgi:hypothetical protein
MFKPMLIGIFLLFIFSCSKDKDETAPVINVTAPVNGQFINGKDTVKVLATISDDKNLDWVKVSLNNSNGIAVISTTTENPSDKNYQLNTSYFVDDVHLASGLYYFDISASDGENVTRKQIEVNLNEVAKTRNGMFVVSNNGATSDITFLDNNYNGSFYQSINGKFLGSAINSYDQQFVHAASNSAGITSIDLKSTNTVWNVSAINPFTGFLYDDRHVFVGLSNFSFKGYDRFGVGNFNGTTNANSYIESAIVHKDYYYVTEQKVIASSNVNLVLYWRASGVEAQQVAINEDIIGLFSTSANQIVLLTNGVSQMGKVVFYDIPLGLKSSPFSINIGKINDCIEISNGVYLTAAGGNLVLVNVNNFTTLPYLNSVAANKIKFDFLTNELFVINGSTITIYDYSSKSIKGTYTHTSNVLNVNFWYNK